MQSDFGDLLNPRSYSGGNCQSSTRGIIAAGFLPAAPTRTNSIEFITMASLGNSTDFGDLATAVSTLGAASNSTRGIFAGGSSPTALRDMQFITIATAGDAQDFGDLDNGGDFNHVKGDVGCCTSPTRCVIGGGSVPGGTGMQFVEIASTGGGTDFGEFGVHAQARSRHVVYWSWRSLNINMEKPSLDTAKAGAMRFNTDSSQMEIYDGNQWTGILGTSPELQTGGTRGLFVVAVQNLQVSLTQ